MTLRRLQWLLAFATAISGAVMVYAQNPISIAQVGTTAVGSTVPVSGSVTATQGTGSNLHVVVDTAPSTAVTNAGTFAVQAAESGTWNITNVSGTVSLPTGASTAAKQPALGAAGTASTDVITIQGIASMTKLLVTPDLPASASTSTKQSDGSQKTQIVDGSGNVIASTSNNLNVQCANCSGSGVSAVDEASFTEGTSVFAASGGYYKSSITPLTTGQQGTVALTPSRSFHVSLYDASGNALLGQQTAAASIPVVLPAASTTAVTQATAANLNAAVVGTGTAGSPAGNILTVQGVASMTKLLVTPDSVALPANQSVNVAQMNGVTTTMGAGATGTGVQRVNDVASAATGAAPPAAAIYVGGLISGATGGFLGGITACDLSKPINISSGTTTLMVTGVSGRQVRICSFHMVTAAANNVAWLEGTGATCGTGTAGMSGGTTAASGYNFAANGGIALGSGLGEVLTTATTGDSVCLITSAATQLAGFIKYTIY